MSDEYEAWVPSEVGEERSGEIIEILPGSDPTRYVIVLRGVDKRIIRISINRKTFIHVEDDEIMNVGRRVRLTVEESDRSCVRIKALPGPLSLPDGCLRPCVYRHCEENASVYDAGGDPACVQCAAESENWLVISNEYTEEQKWLIQDSMYHVGLGVHVRPPQSPDEVTGTYVCARREKILARTADTVDPKVLAYFEDQFAKSAKEATDIA